MTLTVHIIKTESYFFFYSFAFRKCTIISLIDVLNLCRNLFIIFELSCGVRYVFYLLFTNYSWFFWIMVWKIKNPIDHVRFYHKENPNIPIEVKKEEV